MAGALFDIKLLEGALRWWEEQSFLANLRNHWEAGNTTISKADERRLLEFGDQYRSDLLRASKDYLFLSSKYQLGLRREFTVTMTGAGIYAWNAMSRRVFTISDDLRVMLQATSFESAKWSEIPWPFDSFILMFEKPIDLDDGRSIRGVLRAKIKVEDQPVDKVHFIVLLPAALEDYPGSTDKQCAQLIRMYQRNDAAGVREWSQRQAARQRNELTAPVTMMYDENARLSLHTPAQWYRRPGSGPMKQEANAKITEINRLVAAFSLYLSTLAVGTPEHKEHVRPGLIPPAIARSDPRLVSLKSNVCRVTSSFKLTAAEMEAVEDAMERERTGEVVPHWRRGHFRRPPGLGTNPEAKRTVWVQPCFVNRRHLPDGVLPGGALVRVEAVRTDSDR